MAKNRRGGKVTQRSHNLEHRVVALSFAPMHRGGCLGCTHKAFFLSGEQTSST